MPPTSNHRHATTYVPDGGIAAPCTGLASRIRSRIERRLGDRIVDLRVCVDAKHVTLHGQCATYYSKQLAQHAALGVLEDERLENEIHVGLPR